VTHWKYCRVYVTVADRSCPTLRLSFSKLPLGVSGPLNGLHFLSHLHPYCCFSSFLLEVRGGRGTPGSVNSSPPAIPPANQRLPPRSTPYPCRCSQMMSSGPGQSSNLSKVINTTGQTASASQFQISLSGLEGAPQRRVSGSVGTGTSSKALSSLRNNQSRKNQHKRHRRPRLADEDVVAESVCENSYST
jgi:hypothetical protein